MISSIIVAVVFFLLGCSLGCASGWFGHKHKITTQAKSDKSTSGPLYEDLQLSTSLPGDPEKAFELKENVAYAVQ